MGVARLLFVMLAACRDFNTLFTTGAENAIDEAMHAGDAPGPPSRVVSTKRFGLADTVEGVAQNGLNQIQQSLCGTAVRLNPVF